MFNKTPVFTRASALRLTFQMTTSYMPYFLRPLWLRAHVGGWTMLSALVYLNRRLSFLYVVYSI